LVGEAEHAPPAEAAEDEAAQRVDPSGLRVPAESGGAARTLAAARDFLRLDESLQVDECLVDRLG
jgi:hypothetical protein